MLSVLCLALVLSLAWAGQEGVSLHERRDEFATRKWVKRHRLNSEASLPMRIGLYQSNLEKGHDILMDVSRHDSPNYGKWYTPDQVNAMFAPKDESVNKVWSWLHQSGIDHERITQSANLQWLQFDASVEEAENLLNTEYYLYEHSTTGRWNVACDEYHVPTNIQEHIDYITPGIKLLSTEKNSLQRKDLHQWRRDVMSSKRSVDPFKIPIPGGNGTAQGIENGDNPCSQYVTPACIRLLYNFTTASTAQSGNQLGIYQNGDFFTKSDLELFFSKFAHHVPNNTVPKVNGIDGGYNANVSYSLGESNLDLMVSYPIIYPQKVFVYQTNDIHYEIYTVPAYKGLFNTFLDSLDGSYCDYSAFGITGDSANIDPSYPDPSPQGYNGTLQCGIYKPPNVISISYGEQEADLPLAYQRRQCNEFMKLGMQGVSVIFASGDGGVGDRLSDDGNTDGCLGDKGQIFSPDYPATCPYITAVGATTVISAVENEEQAATQFASGGGFSNIYGIPQYQNKSVQAYLSKNLNNYKSYCSQPGTNGSFGADNGVFNRCGRAFPDLAAVGQNVVVYDNGAPFAEYGTSCAAPLFAGLLTRINDERLASYKTPVGFVNPVLYAHPGMFHDITEGSNPGCNTQGFKTSAGWDPVTGLGSPNYPAMLKVFMSLP